MSTLSISPTVRRLRSELKDAVDALTDERERMQLLTKDYEQALAQRGVEAHRVSDVATRLASTQAELQLSEQALDLSRAHARKVFERHDFDAMTREQLVSFAEGAINEARRKGMVEAEGLLSRHNRLSRETDLELMRGVVREYQNRIAEVVQHAEDGASFPAKLDTRPLSAKLDGTAVHPVTKPTAYKAPTWWEVKPAETLQEATGFIPFDRRAAAIAEAAKNKEPHVLNDGAHTTVRGSAGGTYILERKGDVYSCSCPAWRWSQTPSSRRTCKHLEQYLGEKAEHDRITAYLRPVKCYCGQTLVRGQCQVHTRDWKGDEMCRCGRKFASCKAAYDTISVAQRRLGHQPELTK